MTIRKQLPLRDYETFPSSTSSEAGQGSSDTPATTDSDKTRYSAAQEAQRLASRGSWADNVFRTPATTLTPSASTVDEDDRRQAQSQMGVYPSDPPPQYTPTDTTASTIPNSPITARAEVRSSHHPRLASSPSPAMGVIEGDSSSPLLEQGQAWSILPVDESPRWRDGCNKNDRRRRFKKTCFFLFALVLCLWLMLPGLFAINKPVTRGPHHPHSPDDNHRESPIPTWPVPKREYRQHETSQSIHGTFKLYDLLELETNSGSISITVDLQEGKKPAVMRLKTASGSVNIRMAGGSWMSWVPTPQVTTNRTLDLKLSTLSGSINGNVLAGNGGTTEMSTRSGSQSVSIYTVGVGKNDSTTRIATSSQSGSQHLKVISSSESDVRAIQAKHFSSGSGSFGIDYPRTWIGKIHAHSGGSGSVGVSGSDLQKQGGGRDMYAWRGTGDLKEVEVYGQGSGPIRFSC